MSISVDLGITGDPSISTDPGVTEHPDGVGDPRVPGDRGVTEHCRVGTYKRCLVDVSRVGHPTAPIGMAMGRNRAVVILKIMKFAVLGRWVPAAVRC